MCKSTWNLYQSLRAFQRLLANLELLQTLYASEEPNSRFLLSSYTPDGFSEEWRLVSIQFWSSWHSTSVQSWKIMFRKCSCIVKVSGGRFLILETDTPDRLSTLWHLFSKGLGLRCFLVFLRALLQKDGISRESRVTTLFFSLLSIILYSQALEMTVWDIQGKMSSTPALENKLVFLGFLMPRWIQMPLDGHVFLELFF